MVTIPGINCPDFKCVKEHWDKAAAFGAPAVQIDVADGKFAPVKSWDEPAELAVLVNQNPGIAAEIHLMAENPDEVSESWLKAGAKRLAVHIEAAKDIFGLKGMAEKYGAEIILAIKLDTDFNVLEAYLDANPNASVQILDVSAGFSGQAFNPLTLEKIGFLRSRWPNVKIRIDGGMNPETAKRAKDAGADAVIAVSYIWKNESPQSAFKELLNI